MILRKGEAEGAYFAWRILLVAEYRFPGFPGVEKNQGFPPHRRTCNLVESWSTSTKPSQTCIGHRHLTNAIGISASWLPILSDKY